MTVKVTLLPVGRPRVQLELDADDAEVVLAMLDQIEVEDDNAADQRRGNVVGEMRMAGVVAREDLKVRRSPAHDPVTPSPQKEHIDGPEE